MRRFLLTLAAALTSAGIASAQTPPSAPAAPAAPVAPAASAARAFPAPPADARWMRYTHASEVQLRNVAAIVYVTPEARADVAVAVVHRGGVPALELSGHGRKLMIEGGLRREIEECRVLEGGAFSAQVGSTWYSAEQLPTIFLRVPLEAVVAAGGATQIHMARAESVNVSVDGCGDADLEGADGDANISVAGDRPRVRLYDSGAATVRIAGDGDILLGVVRESLTLSIAGDGDFVAAHADGPTTIAITGDGDATIREGRAAPMSVTILGEGNVVHNGSAERLDVAIFGEGDVRVRQVDGQVNRRVFGDGTIIVGGAS